MPSASFAIAMLILKAIALRQNFIKKWRDGNLIPLWVMEESRPINNIFPHNCNYLVMYMNTNNRNYASNHSPETDTR
jgi:hypothetical protein